MDTTTTVAEVPLSDEQLDEIYGGARAETVPPCSSTDCCVEK